ncbi:nucleotidyl transferase AbiEii/AbiGii toxin family protein [Paeniglutamicibacter sp.]|uniref:nucleotidyl transferase AbiEii/AbiGii toxin family protein n=1 Tax=Paeniglutamicibacter sp. TaxID=1934391 RepID=UPI003988B06A
MIEKRYSSPQSFDRAVRDRLKRAAKDGRRNFQELQREFHLQRFLARVFASPDSMWVLKGGTGLLMRLPGSRHSQDLDLLHRSHDLNEAIAELQQLADLTDFDPYRFVLGTPTRMTGGVDGAQIMVTVYLGVQQVGDFPIDLSTHLELVAGVDTVEVAPIIEIDDVPTLPPFKIYPLPDQISDKICAMYELYGEQKNPSTRYRDLADLVSIVSSTSFDAALTARALKLESHRRGLELPPAVRLPAPGWATAYKRASKRFGALDPQFHDVNTAMELVGKCLDPLLTGTRTTGTWHAESLSWQ